jgi:Uma2 family endonuclease
MDEVREPVVAYGKNRFTAEEYLEMENDSISKNEYYRGEIFAMAGASQAHNIIFNNFFIDAGYKLKGKKCRPFGSDMRLHIPENTLFTYPDITFYCKRDDNDKTIGNPTVIIEILSPATKNYDQVEKFELYKEIDTLKEYITIDSSKMQVIRYYINSYRHWEIEEYKNEKDSLPIAVLGYSITLQEIYIDVF